MYIKLSFTQMHPFEIPTLYIIVFILNSDSMLPDNRIFYHLIVTGFSNKKMLFVITKLLLILNKSE